MNKNLTHKQKLNKARVEIDKIDAKLLPLIVKRSRMVNIALESKIKKSQIIDKKRNFICRSWKNISNLGTKKF